MHAQSDPINTYTALLHSTLLYTCFGVRVHEIAFAFLLLEFLFVNVAIPPTDIRNHFYRLLRILGIARDD